MRQVLAIAALISGVAASIATSPVRVQWAVYGHDRATLVVERDSDEAAADIHVLVNAVAMDMPVIEDLPEPSGRPFDPEPEVVELPFSSTLTVDVELVTRGVLGVGANEVDVTLVLLDTEGDVLAEQAVFVEPFEPVSVTLEAPDALADCALGVACERAFELVVLTDSEEPSRVVASVEARQWLRGPVGIDAPEDAALEVLVEPR
ncbi:MAG: hypothetical protein H6737_28685 [Alphaproteobacteria bacterium]|nr:hypothetical protein [Alphaproteobacteria bacterium]